MYIVISGATTQDRNTSINENRNNSILKINSDISKEGRKSETTTKRKIDRKNKNKNSIFKKLKISHISNYNK